MNEIVDSTIANDASMVPDLDQLAQFFIDAFPVMNITEQWLSLKLYALLSEGEAVSLERLSENADIPFADVKTMLESWPGVFYDDNQRIIGFWGITIQEMPHCIDVNGFTVFTWCAWDTLFIPKLLNTTAFITSHCALSGDEITLTISPKGIESAQPDQVMVSFLVPDESKLKEDITTSFCHYIFFFRSREAGEHWVADHPGTFLLSLDDAFAVGKKMNTARYNLTLN